MNLENFTLLYVEDNKDMQSYMKSFLEDEVKVFYQAYNGEEGVEIYQNKSPDIILTDINMPKMDGLEMSKIIKEFDPLQPIIVLSAFQDAEILKRAINIGVDGFISKPINDIKNLLNTLEKVAVSLQNRLNAKLLEQETKEKTALASHNKKLDTILHEKLIELESINATLEERIQKEVQANREKDKQIFYQSRLAQMGEMISMIAHQWRQPLNAISATSQNIQIKAEMGTITDEIILKETENINNYSEHLSQTIDDFRNFFKPQKKLTRTEYTELITSVLNITRASLKGANISIIKDLHCTDIFETHTNELKQVILNLLQNAKDILIENKVENAFIKLKTYNKDDHYILELSDNGGGVPLEIQSHIFDPYFSTKSEKNGTGLGLYMSKTIIEKHCGGQLTTYNNDYGAVFKISLKEKRL